MADAEKDAGVDMEVDPEPEQPGTPQNDHEPMEVDEEPEQVKSAHSEPVVVDEAEK